MNRGQDEPGQNSKFSLQLAIALMIRSGLTGLIAGSVLGALFGVSFYLAALWTGTVGAALGLGLGLINGILLSGITRGFFVPLRRVQRYRAVAMVLGAGLAGSGAAMFGPWYFASKAITPISAVGIGFHSVLASVIAGWAGALAGKNLAKCYEQASSDPSARIAIHPFSPRSNSVWVTQRWSWLGVALLTLLCSFWGYGLLKLLVCGIQEEYFCLPSPRLFTSVTAGFRVVLPIILGVLLVVVLGDRFKRRS